MENGSTSYPYGESPLLRGHLAVIFLMLAFAAWIYGVLHLGETAAESDIAESGRQAERSC